MYEKISDRLVPVEHFIKRIAAHSLLVVVIMALSIAIGVTGFVLLENKNVEDAILHSVFMLSGFGLVEMPRSLPGKLFVGVYGLYSSVFFLAAFSIIFAPILHRILHKLHLDSDEQDMRD